ncbi:MAG: bile acid:sodium symporter family protein [Gammaproteobacteria bacterium]
MSATAQTVLTWVIGALMLGVGMSLRVADFTGLLAAPRSTVVGLLAMFLMFPALAFGIVWLFPLTPASAVGLVLLAACPSSSTSTLMTYLARGDVALSLALTAFSKLVPVVTIPVFVGLAARLFIDEGTALNVSIAVISGRLLQMVLLPTLAGMLLRAYFPAFTQRAQVYVTRGAVLFLVLTIVALSYRERQALPGMLLSAGPAALTLCVLGMACAHALGRLSRLSGRQRAAITLEVGMQSAGTAISLAAGVMAAPALAVPAAVYAPLMYLVAGAFVYWQRRGPGAAGAV